MIDLASYANYLRTQRLDDVNRKQFELFRSENIRLINALLQNGEEKTILFLRERLYHLLVSFEQGNGVAYINERLEMFRNNQIPDISTAMVSIEDVLLMTAFQRQALLSFVTEFTTEPGAMLVIIQQLEAIYIHLVRRSMEIFNQLSFKKNQELKESEERYRDLFDNAHELIHIVDPDGTIRYVNSFWMRSLGYHEEEIGGKSIYSFVDEEDRERFIQYRKDVLAGKAATQEVQIRFVTKEGNRLIVEGFVSPFLKNGQPVYTRGIFRDITLKVRDQERLRYYNDQLLEREENLSQLIRHAPDAIIVIDADSRIILWNPKAEQIFGWSENEVKGTRLSESIVPLQYRKAHDEGMRRYLVTGEAHVLNKTIELTALNKKGAEFHISLTISGFRQGGKEMFISFLRDISEQRKNAIELERKKKELEESNRELEQYGWLTSHDLREPLRKILTYSDIILSRDGELPADVSASVEKIHQAGRRMGSLIQSILLYSSLSGEEEMYTRVNLNEIVEEVLADLELSIRENAVQVSVGSLPSIDAIPFQMRQLFQNLFSNSIKYRKPEEPPAISIRSVLHENEVEIIIEDNGIGFNSKDNDKAFQLFQRLHADRKTEGTGIGLAICKKIALSHGGSIRAESEPGHGARFIVRLPLHHNA